MKAACIGWIKKIWLPSFLRDFFSSKIVQYMAKSKDWLISRQIQKIWLPSFSREFLRKYRALHRLDAGLSQKLNSLCSKWRKFALRASSQSAQKPFKSRNQKKKIGAISEPHLMQFVVHALVCVKGQVYYLFFYLGDIAVKTYFKSEIQLWNAFVVHFRLRPLVFVV